MLGYYSLAEMERLTVNELDLATWGETVARANEQANRDLLPARSLADEAGPALTMSDIRADRAALSDLEALVNEDEYRRLRRCNCRASCKHRADELQHKMNQGGA